MPKNSYTINMGPEMCGLQDPQVMLSRALHEKNLTDFKIALESEADPTRMDDKHISVFEKALQTPGSADFIVECLRRGCQADYVNHYFKKSPINFVADSKDPSNLAVLLQQNGINVNRKYATLTALSSLAKNMKPQNAENAFDCIKMLLAHGADPNLPDNQDMTAMNHLIDNESLDEKKKREIIEYFLANGQIDLDTYRDGEAREELENQYPDLKLPPPTSTGGEANFDLLLSRLRNHDEDSFITEFAKYQNNRSNNENQKNVVQEEYIQLLFEAIKGNLLGAFRAILKTDLNVSMHYNNNTAIEIAAIWGNSKALKELVDHDQCQIRPKDNLLKTVIQHLDENQFSEHSKCFYTLLDSDKIDINATDDAGLSPLHYAVRYKHDKAIKELLKRGAYIGTRSIFNTLPISEINPDQLEEYFDSCITTSDAKPGDPHLEIHIDFKNLIPRRDPKQSEFNVREEMIPITHIAETKELRHLLQHPLITSFLFLKWHRLSTFFYLNFFIYFVYCLSLMSLIVLQFNKSEHTAVLAVLQLIVCLGTLYLIVRELLQFLMSPQSFLHSITNYMEIALIILTICTLSKLDYDKEGQRVIAVFTILLASVELCLLVGSLPVLSISTHMLMLRAVTKSFMKSFTLYSIFVVTFSLSFYVMFGTNLPKGDGGELEKIGSNVTDSSTEAAAAADDGEFNKFANPYTAVIKTIVMLTGEFDAGDIAFNSPYSYLIFLLFVFFMTMVLFNLLNGLAVSDTQMIKAQAELNGSICRASLLRNYERVLTGRDGKTSYIVQHPPFRQICKNLANLFPHYISGHKIAILPNADNLVLIPVGNALEIELGSATTRRNENGQTFTKLPGREFAASSAMKTLAPPVKTMPCCCSFVCRRCSQMDGRTVKTALAVLERKSTNEREKHKELQLENRVRSIEDKLAKVYELLLKKE